MKRLVFTFSLLALGSATAWAAPQAPLQAPTQAPGKAAAVAVQSPAQSPVQKGGAITAQANTGYRTYSYQPEESYYAPSRAFYRNGQPSWLNAGSKAAGRY